MPFSGPYPILPSAGSVLSGRPGPTVPESGVWRSLAIDLLGRPPLAAERAAWGGRARAEVTAELLGRVDFWQNWLEEQLYYFLLIDNFRPETEGVTDLPADLAGQKVGVVEALHRICLSSSFDRRNPGPDTFVSVVMEQLLGLTVQKLPRELEIGKRLYDGASGKFLGQAGSSQADVVHLAIQDPRCLRHFLAREYERLVRRAIEPKGLEAQARRLQAEPRAYPAIVQEWLASPAYEERLGRRLPLTNRLFVRTLFVDLQGRLPEFEEGQRLRSALDGLADSRPLRALVARLMLDSGQVPVPERAAIPDPGAWLSESFERLLGRSITAAESAEFQAAFADPACRPATVLYAIVSHPEYQTW